MIYILILVGITLLGMVIPEGWVEADFSIKNQAPTGEHIFGTDWLGRDMFFRTIKGLSNSIVIACIASIISAIIGAIVGVVAGVMPKKVDYVINWIIDLFMSIPHMVLLILISFCVGQGEKGVLIGIACTHWTSLARVIRGEVLQIREEHYIKLSRRLGKSKYFIIKNHMIPHIAPQFLIGLILMFPHAILHEAAITFLGFGLPPEKPAIGIILSESMNYIATGMWWLAFFPGIVLIGAVVLVDKIGNNCKKVYNQYE